MKKEKKHHTIIKTIKYTETIEKSYCYSGLTENQIKRYEEGGKSREDLIYELDFTETSRKEIDYDTHFEIWTLVEETHQVLDSERII